jgi:hypothetical protein
MRQICLSLFLLALSVAAKGQEFKLLEIKESLNDSLISKSPPVDLNGNISAVVILSFGEPIYGLTFRGNVIKSGAIRDSVYALYVSHGTKRITLQHEDFYPFVVDFQESGVKIESGHAYYAMIDNKTSEETNGQTYRENQTKVEARRLIFKSDIPIKKLLVNDNVWPFEKGSSTKLVPCGVYHYRAESIDGKIAEGQVEVSNKSLKKTVNIIF